MEYLLKEPPSILVCAVFDRCRASASPVAVRDAALLTVYFGARLPFADIAALDRADYRGDGVLFRPDRRELRAREGARESLEAWCWLRGDRAGPLFARVGPSGTVSLRRPSPASLRRRVRARMSAVGAGEVPPMELADAYRSPWWHPASRLGSNG